MTERDLSFHLKNITTVLVNQAYKVVTPEFLHDFWKKEDISEDDFPKSLSLRIAEKEDTDKIEAFFQSRRKQNADPGNFVKPRPEDPVEGLSERGHIALIEDHNEDITAICFAFTHYVEDMPGHELKQNHTEIGTVLSCAKGLGLTGIAISALTLAIKEKEGEDHPIIAKVSKENAAANGLFGKALTWSVTEKTDAIRALFKSSAGDTMRPDEPTAPYEDKEIAESRNWYVFDETAEDQAKDLLYSIKKDKELHTKAKIAVPFTFDDEDFDISFDRSDRVPDEDWTNTVKVDIGDPDAVRIAGLYNANIGGDGESDLHLVEAEEKRTDLQGDEYTEINDLADSGPGPLEELNISREAEQGEGHDETDVFEIEDELYALEAQDNFDEDDIMRRLNTEDLAP